MVCPCCDHEMTLGVTTFTVVKNDAVYIVQEVPALDCSTCGHASFPQETAKLLERYTSGRAIPTRTMTAWTFRWGEPIIEISKTSIKGTEAPKVLVSTRGTG